MTNTLTRPRAERILLHAMEEVLGAEGLRSVMGAAHASIAPAVGSQDMPGALAGTDPAAAITLHPAPVEALQQAFEDVYGVPAGRGLALRVGRACFQYGLREYGQALALTGADFRLLPMPSKLRRFGAALAQLFNTQDNERIRIEEQDGRLLVHLLHCPLCSGRHTTQPACPLAVGLAEEALYWLSGGKIFMVEETACAARGDVDCVVQIDMTPIS
jgi:predicted hydrocarbon binding protein